MPVLVSPLTPLEWKLSPHVKIGLPKTHLRWECGRDHFRVGGVKGRAGRRAALKLDLLILTDEACVVLLQSTFTLWATVAIEDILIFPSI